MGDQIARADQNAGGQGDKAHDSQECTKAEAGAESPQEISSSIECESPGRDVAPDPSACDTDRNIPCLDYIVQGKRRALRLVARSAGALSHRVVEARARVPKPVKPRLHRRIRRMATRVVPSALREWDRADYAMVALASALAIAADTVIVKTPKTSSLTELLKSYDTTTSNDPIARRIRALGKLCKVPYDRTICDGAWISGMCPKSHRFQTLGHDPILGLVFGVYDIMNGTATGFTYDQSDQQHTFFHRSVPGTESETELIAAVLRHMGHLLSDVGTPMGLPTPFMTLLQGFNVGHFGEYDLTVAEVARAMYREGYDLRHFLVTGIVPATVEIVLRAYAMLRYYSERGEMPKNLDSIPKYRLMLAVAHATVAVGNATLAFRDRDWLKLNGAQWETLARYVVPHIARLVVSSGRRSVKRIRRTALCRREKARKQRLAKRPELASPNVQPLAALVPVM